MNLFLWICSLPICSFNQLICFWSICFLILRICFHGFAFLTHQFVFNRFANVKTNLFIKKTNLCFWKQICCFSTSICFPPICFRSPKIPPADGQSTSSSPNAENLARQQQASNLVRGQPTLTHTTATHRPNPRHNPCTDQADPTRLMKDPHHLWRQVPTNFGLCPGPQLETCNKS